jgi:hypothetical protein
MTLVTSTRLAGVRPLGLENQYVVDRYRQLVDVIRSRLGAAHADLFARPERQTSRAGIDWHTDLEGEVRGLADLPPEQQMTIEAVVAARTTAVRELGAELQGGDRNSRRLGELLQRAVTLPGRDSIYLVGTQPVLVLWGFEREIPGYMSRPSAPPSAPAHAAEFASLAASSRTGRDWLRWLLLLVLLLLLGFLTVKACEPLPPVVVENPEPRLDLGPDIVRADEDNADLASKLEDARKLREQQLAACIAPPEPIKRVDIEPPSAVEQRELPEPPELVPIPPIEKVPKEQVQALQSPPTSPPAHKNCVPQRKPYEAPEMVLVVDGSGSMSDPISGAPTRLDAAKRSISELVDGLPGDVDVGLIEFSDCDRVNRDGFYRVSERGQLKQRVNGLLPREGTPLGLSVERAGRIISSRRPGVIVVVSDGMDSCFGDPCGAAQRIAAKKPNVRINVIDISGSSGNPTARCMAQATRGRVFQPNSVGEMEVMVQQAGGEPDIRLCK